MEIIGVWFQRHINKYGEILNTNTIYMFSHHCGLHGKIILLNITIQNAF